MPLLAQFAIRENSICLFFFEIITEISIEFYFRGPYLQFD